MNTKFYVVALAACIAAVACSKSSSKPEENQPAGSTPSTGSNIVKYPVHFGLGNIDVVESGRLNKRELPAGSFLRYIFYGAYDSMGRLASKKIQDLNNVSAYPPDYGLISDSLPAGKYTIVLAGGNWSFFEEENSIDSLLNVVKFASKHGQDIFYKKFDINVSAKDTTYGNVRLNRITGLFQYQLTDTLPENVAMVSVSIDNLPTYFSPFNESLSGIDSIRFYNNYNRIDNPLISGQFSFLASPNKHRITISARTEFDRPVYEKVIDNVSIYPNKVTLLRGKLSDAPVGGNPIIIVGDPDYADTTYVNF